VRDGDVIIVESHSKENYFIPDNLMREMRSSVVFLGAIIARNGMARISMPGGCELGPRPIDLHLSSLEKLGVTIEEDHGYLNCTVKDCLKGADIALYFPSVGATENIMLAAVLAKGRTKIQNAAREPEIRDLADFLCKCGAKINIDNEGTIYIDGVKKLYPAEHTVIPDRIATATYLAAAAITGGDILISNCNPSNLSAVFPVFEQMGCVYTLTSSSIYLKAPSRLKAVRTIKTMPYPGFPTDAQSPVMSLAAVADGTSVFVENIFESRYKQVPELLRMGAKIKVEGKVAVVEGVNSMHSASVECTDLRGGASVAVAALQAEGKTIVNNIKHIERGYESFEQRLASIGASIKKL